MLPHEPEVSPGGTERLFCRVCLARVPRSEWEAGNEVCAQCLADEQPGSTCTPACGWCGRCS